VIWIDRAALQASVFGLPGRHLLTAEPLDDYRRRGLLACDPRTTIDPAVADLLTRLARVDAPGCAIGPRLLRRGLPGNRRPALRLGFPPLRRRDPRGPPDGARLGRAALS
jgi:pyruvate,orthophosphate dikinase